MSHFFIGRPVFAAVIAILICLAGAISLATMPVSQFPKLTPPTVSLTCSYDGASAKTMQDSIAQVIEQRMTGLDKLLYINTGSSSEGRMSMRLTFDPSVDGDIAQMQVQNRLQLAMPRLPESVKNEGVRVRKVSDTFLEFYSFYEENGRIPTSEIGDFLSSTLVDPLTRLDGVGDATLFGAPYAMRIWLNPNRLRSFSLTPMDVVDAVKAQNDQISVGQIGALPALEQTAGVAEHGAVQLVDGPGGIEQGNICPGGQQTPAGVLPAGEDFRPHDALAVGVHDALQIGEEFTPADGSLRLALLPGQLPGGGDTAERGLILRDRQNRRHRCQRPFCTEIKPTNFGRPAKRVTGGVWP